MAINAEYLKEQFIFGFSGFIVVYTRKIKDLITKGENRNILSMEFKKIIVPLEESALLYLFYYVLKGCCQVKHFITKS